MKTAEPVMAHHQEIKYLSDEERAEEVNEWIHFG